MERWIMEKLKGLAIIYDPHNLYQFVWYYCNKGKQKEWDALCLPNGYKGEYMHTFCEEAEIFSKIYKYDTDFSNASILKKFKIVMSMFGHFIIGQREWFCRKFINSYVDLDDYDEIVVIADVGLVSGACVALGKEKEVVILEDGISDYGKRPRWISREKMKSPYNWQGFFLAIMGYSSPGWFKLNTNKYCIKYSSQPGKMLYQNYKEIRKLYTSEGTDEVLFDQIIKRIYPVIDSIDFENADVVLFTRSLKDFVDDDAKYKMRIENYIDDRYKNILLKRHPREQGAYCFKEGIKCVEIDNSVPAEALLPYLRGKDILLITTSAVMLYMKAYQLNCKIILLKGMYEESIASSAQYRPLSEEEVIEYCKKFAEGCYTITTI